MSSSPNHDFFSFNNRCLKSILSVPILILGEDNIYAKLLALFDIRNIIPIHLFILRMIKICKLKY